MQELRNRLARMGKHWAKWARRREITCYRVYDRDLPEYPFIAEIYGEHLVLTEMSNESLRLRKNFATWKEEVVSVFCSELGINPDHVHLKTRSRHGEGEQYEKLAEREGIIVQEAGLKFAIYPDNWLDTGLFLDHRNLRAKVRNEAAGKKVLNLFCYTGSFSVFAAAGGATLVHNVDLSARYLEIAVSNLKLNNLKPGEFESFRQDAREFLNRENPISYDIIICDAPVFSRSHRQERDFDVLRDHPQLIRDCLRLLNPAGTLYFSTNFRKFKIQFPEASDKALVQETTAQTIPEDFRNKRIHTAYRIVHALN
jgi:23S rRNA (cytosine1962-C5)-methyltransferase